MTLEGGWRGEGGRGGVDGGEGGREKDRRKDLQGLLHIQIKITRDLFLYSLSKVELPSLRRGRDTALGTTDTGGPSIGWGGKKHLRSYTSYRESKLWRHSPSFHD